MVIEFRLQRPLEENQAVSASPEEATEPGIGMTR